MTDVSLYGSSNLWYVIFVTFPSANSSSPNSPHSGSTAVGRFTLILIGDFELVTSILVPSDDKNWMSIVPLCSEICSDDGS